MSNWEIVPQEQTIKGETSLVDCKQLVWRPASDKEQEAGSGEFKKLGTPTYRVCFKHIKDDGIFRVVAQLRAMKRKGSVIKDGSGQPVMEWRVNLHDPDKTQPVQMNMKQRTTCVTIDHPFKVQTIKTSTGTVPYDSFFDRVFPERIRDTSLRVNVMQLLDNAIFEREAKAA